MKSFINKSSVVDRVRAKANYYRGSEEYGYKYFAFSRAASALANSELEVDEMTFDNLIEIPYIGESSANLILGIIESGDLPVTAEALIEQLRVDQKLVYELGERKINELGYKIAEKWLEPIYNVVLDIPRLSIAGSLRRGSLVIRDFDLVYEGTYEEFVNDLEFRSQRDSSLQIIGGGTAMVRVRLVNNGLELEGDVKICSSSNYGPMMLHLTGPKNHNITMRRLAKSKGFTLNEYGLWSGDSRIDTNTEESIYDRLGMAYHLPQHRR